MARGRPDRAGLRAQRPGPLRRRGGPREVACCVDPLAHRPHRRGARDRTHARDRQGQVGSAGSIGREFRRQPPRRHRQPDAGARTVAPAVLVLAQPGRRSAPACRGPADHRRGRRAAGSGRAGIVVVGRRSAAPRDLPGLVLRPGLPRGRRRGSADRRISQSDRRAGGTAAAAGRDRGALARSRRPSGVPRVVRCRFAQGQKGPLVGHPRAARRGDGGSFDPCTVAAGQRGGTPR